jgi:hypothetical protein
LALKSEGCFRTTHEKLPFLCEDQIYKRKFYEDYHKSRKA